MDSVSIDEVYGELSTDERLQVVDAMARLISQMRATTFTKSGKLEPAKDETIHARDILPTLSQWKYASINLSPHSDPAGARTPTGADTHHGQGLGAHYAQRLDAVLEQMAEDPFFMATAEEPCCLFFRDFLPGKIFLRKDIAAGKWTISRLTCDNVWSVKETVAASPPSWLWGGILGSEKFILKKRYDQAMSKTRNPTSSHQDPDYYMKQTYGIGKWFRRLMHCQLFTPPGAEIEKFLQGWAVYAELHGLNTSEVEPQTSIKTELPENQTFLCDTPQEAYRPCNTNSPEQLVPEQATTNTRLNGNVPKTPEQATTGQATTKVRLDSNGPKTPPQPILKQPKTETRLTRSNSNAKRSVHFGDSQVVVEPKESMPFHEYCKTQAFAAKVQGLCSYLGISTISGISTSRGGYITFASAEGKTYMLSLPYPQATKDEVACHLAAGTITTVPKVVAYDSTSSSPYLKRPFILYEALPGENAWQLANSGYTAESRFGVAIKLAAIAQKISSKGLRSAGYLIADPEMPASTRYPDARKPRTGIKPFASWQSNERLTLQRFVEEMLIYQASKPFVDPLPGGASSSAHSSLVSSSPQSRYKVMQAYRNLHTILTQMASLHLLDNQAYEECVLFNPNTSPFNVFVSGDGNEPGFKLEGIVSWKGCLSLPRIFAHPPPTWLWRVAPPSSKKRGYWWLTPFNVPNNNNHKDLAVMKCYDNTRETDLQRTYNINEEKDTHIRLIKWLGYFGLEGQLEKETNWTLYERFLIEWDNYCAARRVCDFSVPRPEGYRPSYRDSAPEQPPQWKDKWKNERTGERTLVPPPPDIRSFRNARRLSHLALPEREKYFEVESHVSRDTTFLAIADALYSCNGSVRDAVERINGRASAHASRAHGSAAETAPRTGSSSAPSVPLGPPPTIHKGFRIATHTSDLSPSDRAKYNQVQSRAQAGTPFQSIRSALFRTGGSVEGAVDLITRLNGRAQPQTNTVASIPGATPRGPSIGQTAAPRPPSSTSNAAVPAGPRATLPLNSAVPGAPSGPRVPQQHASASALPPRLSGAPGVPGQAGPPGPPGTSSQYRSSLRAPSPLAPSSASQAPIAAKRPAPPNDDSQAERELKKAKTGTNTQNRNSLGAPPPLAPSSAFKANLPAPAAPKCPALPDDAQVERELRAKVDRCMEKARETVNTAMEPAGQYPQQVYVRGQEGGLQERDANLPPRGDRGRAPSPDNECVITEVRKLKSSSEDEDSDVSTSESSGEDEVMRES